MIKTKKNGFTLSEALITLTIVGALAVLVLPGIIKDTMNKANMALLQSTVSALNDAVQNELARTRVTSIEDTLIKSDPQKFLKTMGAIKVSNAKKPIFYPSGNYKSIKGTSVTPGSTSTASAILKNGVGVSINTTRKMIDNAKYYEVFVDLNGKQEPNIVGVDAYMLYLVLENASEGSINEAVHIGDIGSIISKSATTSSLKTSCNGGTPSDCYALAEQSGFDPNYLSN